MAPKQAWQEALVSSIYRPPEGTSALALTEPVTVNGCTLQPPPTTVQIGPVFKVNIVAWKAAADSSEAGYLRMTTGLSKPATAWVLSQYGKISAQKLKTFLQLARPTPVMRTLIKPIMTSGKPVGIKIGDLTFLVQYKGLNAPWPANQWPADFDALSKWVLTDGYYLLWKELIDGEEPIAKVKPPFNDDHAWVLRAGLTGRTIKGVDAIKDSPTFGQPQSELEAQLILRRVPHGTLHGIESALGAVLDVLESVLEAACGLITTKKLQEVRNYGVMFPNPYVQAAMLAWEGVAQACGAVFPANATGPPDCALTAEKPPLPEPDPWWKVHQGWLIGGGIAAAGVLGIVVFLRRARA